MSWSIIGAVARWEYKRYAKPRDLDKDFERNTKP